MRKRTDEQKAKHAEYNRNWYLENKEITKQRAAEWVTKHPEKRKQIVDRYYQSHNVPQRVANGRVKARTRGHVFAVNVEEVEHAHEVQRDLCAICGKHEQRKQNGVVQALAIDHCHITGRFRGLLCEACNKILGFVEDSGERLQAAIAYLQQGLRGDEAPFQLEDQLF